MDRTVCEVNGRLVSGVQDGQTLRVQRSATTGAQVYPTIEGGSATSLQQLVNEGPNTSTQQEAKTASSPVLVNVEQYAADTLSEVKKIGASYKLINRLLSWIGVQYPPHTARTRSIAWHGRQQQLAICDGGEQVRIYDVANTVRSASNATDLASPTAVATLQHEDQKQVVAVQYRAHSPGMLAVAGLGIVTLWDLHSPGKSPALTTYRLLHPERLGTLLVDLAWSPSGRLLAAAHGDSAGFTVWDVAMGQPTTISAGIAPTSLLEWSPDDSYLLTATPESGFQLWETSRWTNISFQAGSGQVTAACWSADSKTVLLASSNAPHLTALYLIGPAYSLRAQLLSVELPSFISRGAGSHTGKTVGCMAWDRKGARLAVGYGEGHDSAGHVALYSTSCKPVVSAQLIGKIIVGESAKPIQALAFHPRVSSGALLSVGTSSGQTTILPLIYN